MFATADADAARRKKRAPEPEPVVEEVEPPRQPPIRLFPDPLPVASGPTPAGLANGSAQGCAGCHVEAHASWSRSAHATGWRGEAFQAAVARVGTPACTRCHLPLLGQEPLLVSWDGGDINRPVTSPNPAFDASLRLEGVSCAACHVRDGAVVAARPVESIGPAPHPLVWSEDLAGSAGCATCHQLTWPGTDSPLYDTYGEWERSAYAAAGVRCQDCHGAGSQGFDHGTPRGAERAVSVLLQLAELELVRGADPVPLGITLQNTGAGHAFPTGSPFVGVALLAWLEGPPDRRGNPTRTEPFVVHLARTLEEVAPWRTIEDTRLGAGATRVFGTHLALPQDAPDGRWSLRVELAETARGEITDRVLLARDLPLRVR